MTTSEICGEMQKSMLPANEISTPFFIPESEKGAEWSANAVRFYTNAYFNRPFFELNANRGNLVDTYHNLCPIDDIIENWKYYLGDQQIGVNSALINGRSAKALYRAGLEINSLVNHKVGQLESVLQSSKPTAEAFSNMGSPEHI